MALTESAPASVAVAPFIPRLVCPRRPSAAKIGSGPGSEAASSAASTVSGVVTSTSTSAVTSESSPAEVDDAQFECVRDSAKFVSCAQEQDKYRYDWSGSSDSARINSELPALIAQLDLHSGDCDDAKKQKALRRALVRVQRAHRQFEALKSSCDDDDQGVRDNGHADRTGRGETPQDGAGQRGRWRRRAQQSKEASHQAHDHHVTNECQVRLAERNLLSQRRRWASQAVSPSTTSVEEASRPAVSSSAAGAANTGSGGEPHLCFEIATQTPIMSRRGPRRKSQSVGTLSGGCSLTRRDGESHLVASVSRTIRRHEGADQPSDDGDVAKVTVMAQKQQRPRSACPNVGARSRPVRPTSALAPRVIPAPPSQVPPDRSECVESIARRRQSMSRRNSASSWSSANNDADTSNVAHGIVESGRASRIPSRKLPQHASVHTAATVDAAVSARTERSIDHTAPSCSMRDGSASTCCIDGVDTGVGDGSPHFCAASSSSARQADGSSRRVAAPRRQSGSNNISCSQAARCSSSCSTRRRAGGPFHDKPLKPFLTGRRVCSAPTCPATAHGVTVGRDISAPRTRRPRRTTSVSGPPRGELPISAAAATRRATSEAAGRWFQTGVPADHLETTSLRRPRVVDGADSATTQIASASSPVLAPQLGSPSRLSMSVAVANGEMDSLSQTSVLQRFPHSAAALPNSAGEASVNVTSSVGTGSRSAGGAPVPMARLDLATDELERLLEETHQALLRDGLLQYDDTFEKSSVADCISRAVAGIGARKKGTSFAESAMSVPSLDAVDRALEELQRGLVAIDGTLAEAK